MNNFLTFMSIFVTALLIVIGVVCYKVSESTFYNYLIFLVPIALIRLLRSILLIKTYVKK